MKKEYIVELREEEANELMDEHWVGELVRCKDCKNAEPAFDGKVARCKIRGLRKNDWFCADGEWK